jgi:hypothetical protein
MPLVSRPWVPKEITEAINLAIKFPYITEYYEGTFCDGWIKKNGRNGRCTKVAYWHYKAGSTKKPHAKSGYFCWYHLITKGIQATKYDIDRAHRAQLKVEKES